MSTLIEQYQKAVADNRESVAISFKNQTIEYGRLDEAVRRLASGLLGLGISPGDRVALMLPNLPHFPIGYYGILLTGATIVPLNIMLSKDDLRYVLKDCQAKAIIAWGGFTDKILYISKDMDISP